VGAIGAYEVDLGPHDDLLFLPGIRGLAGVAGVEGRREERDADGGCGETRVGVEVGEVGEVDGGGVVDGFQGARGVEMAG